MTNKWYEFASALLSLAFSLVSLKLILSVACYPAISFLLCLTCYCRNVFCFDSTPVYNLKTRELFQFMNKTTTNSFVQNFLF